MVERYIFSWLVLSCVLFAGLASSHKARSVSQTAANVPACGESTLASVQPVNACQGSFAGSAD